MDIQLELPLLGGLGGGLDGLSPELGRGLEGVMEGSMEGGMGEGLGGGLGEGFGEGGQRRTCVISIESKAVKTGSVSPKEIEKFERDFAELGSDGVSVYCVLCTVYYSSIVCVREREGDKREACPGM